MSQQQQPKDAAGMTTELANQVEVIIGVAARLQTDPGYLDELAAIEAGIGPGHPPTLQGPIIDLHNALLQLRLLAAALLTAPAPRPPERAA